uniref:TSA: Wollemia nobilis Ref_Wollemi_Transcript_3705_2455 transcribed RNA sequence n=1 Tax=Wollemia nobilis TaxID=56998 RepID=A0A0C9SAF7_9CONI
MDLEVFDRQAGSKRTYNRLARPPPVCIYWQEGKCNRDPCNFLHVGEPGTSKRVGANNGFAPKRSYHVPEDVQTAGPPGGSRRNTSAKWGRGLGGRIMSDDHKQKVHHKVCSFWLAGNCKHGADCKFLHSFVIGEDVTFLTQLVGHEKAVRGIALPSNSDKLYSGGQDGTVRVWDCQTGECSNVIKLGGEVGCLLSEGPWLFVGLPNAVKAWNISTSTDLSLDGPRGQVHAIVVGNGMLLAGIQDGNILAWKFSAVSNSFEPAASLAGHTSAVITLVSGADRLYSGSMDHTIRVWDLGTFQCMQTLGGHTSVVMSLLCWDQFLLSCSLDNTVKVWVASSSGALEVTYTHDEQHGVLAMCGMHDEQAKPVLLCSCNDNSVRLYDLPSFHERGKIFSRNEVRAIQIGPGGLFFTGDGMGDLKVWKWATQAS